MPSERAASKSIRAKCALCGREVATRNALRGDGTERYPVRHNDLGNRRPCDGYLTPAIGWGSIHAE